MDTTLRQQFIKITFWSAYLLILALTVSCRGQNDAPAEGEGVLNDAPSILEAPAKMIQLETIAVNGKLLTIH